MFVGNSRICMPGLFAVLRVGHGRRRSGSAGGFFELLQHNIFEKNLSAGIIFRFIVVLFRKVI